MKSAPTLLTYRESKNIIISLSEKIANVIGVTETNGISRFQCGFFMQKIQFYIVMSNWVGQSKDWLDSFVPVRQFYLVRLHNWRYVVGLKTLQTEAVMPNSYAQNQKKPSTLTLKASFKSIFFLMDRNRKTIADRLTLDQAKSLSEQLPNSKIKFQKMEAVL